MNERERKQKESEVQAFRALRRGWSSMPAGLLILREAPDLCLMADDRCIGIEVTELHHPPDARGIVRQRQDGEQHVIAERVTNLLRATDCPPVQVDLNFRRYYGLARGDRDDTLKKSDRGSIAQALAEWIPRHLPSPGDTRQLSLWRHPTLHDIIDHVWLNRLPSLGAPVCTCSGGGVVPAIRAERLQETIEDKEEDQAAYPELLDAHWLIITTADSPFSRYFDYQHCTTRDTLDRVFETTFDKAFLVHVSTDKVHILTKKTESSASSPSV